MKKIIDLCVLVLLLIIAYFLAQYIIPIKNSTLILPIFIFFLPPILYLSFREKKDWLKIFAGVFSFGILLTLSFFLILEHTDSWVVKKSTFEYKVFNILVIDEIITILLIVTLVFVYYQHFLLKKIPIKKKLSKRYFKITLSILIIVSVIIFLFIKYPSFYSSKLAYFKTSIIVLLVPIIFIKRNPQYLKKLILIIPYFFLLFLIVDIISIKFNIMDFNGDYLMLVNLFGVEFPIEEIITYFTFYAPILICCYESSINLKEGY